MTPSPATRALVWILCITTLNNVRAQECNDDSAFRAECSPLAVDVEAGCAPAAATGICVGVGFGTACQVDFLPSEGNACEMSGCACSSGVCFASDFGSLCGDATAPTPEPTPEPAPVAAPQPVSAPVVSECNDDSAFRAECSALPVDVEAGCAPAAATGICVTVGFGTSCKVEFVAPEGNACEMSGCTCSFGVCFASDLGSYCGTTTGPVCSNGISGLENTDTGICCAPGCPQCGGAGCGAGGADDCCNSNILAAKQLCVDTGVAPCIIGDEDDNSAIAAEVEDPAEAQEDTEADSGSATVGVVSSSLFTAAAVALGAASCVPLIFRV